MSQEQNKTIVRRSFEQLDKGNLAAAVESCARDAVIHLWGIPRPMNRDGLCHFLVALRSAFPDIRHSIEAEVAEGDITVVRFTAQGTHRGDFQGIPPTGKQVTFQGTVMDRVVEGRIVERWFTYDALGLLGELGFVPRYVHIAA